MFILLNLNFSVDPLYDIHNCCFTNNTQRHTNNQYAKILRGMSRIRFDNDEQKRAFDGIDAYDVVQHDDVALAVPHGQQAEAHGRRDVLHDHDAQPQDREINDDHDM